MSTNSEYSTTSSSSEDEGQSTDGKKDKDEKKKCHWVSTCGLYCVIVIAFYAGLSLILAISQANSVGDLEEKKEDISLAVSNETCSAKSYLLADGVCDEVTNRERCFYDGGDCCLESYKKDTKFCQDCSCRGVFGRNLTFFFAEANRNDNNIVFKLDPTRGGGFAQHLYTVNALIQDVTTIGVCSLVCTEPEKSLLINAWLYDSSTRVCSCIVIDKKLCRDEIGTEASILEMEQNINSSSVWLFVNMTKADVKTHCKETIVLITGHPHHLSNSSEVLSYHSNNNVDQESFVSNWDCNNFIPSLPQIIAGATGATLSDGTIMICGGYQGSSPDFEGICYVIQPEVEGEQWTEIKMTSARYFAASVVHPNGASLIISGGYQKRGDSSYKILDSLEIVHQTSFPEVFEPPMPTGLAEHCLILLQPSSTLMAIGGRSAKLLPDGNTLDQEVSDLTFLLSSSIWSDGPKLSVPREGHACGTLTDPISGSLVIVIAGGFKSDSKSEPALDSTEFLVVSNSNVTQLQWTTGPKLIQPLSYASLIPVDAGSKLILLGGSGSGNYIRSIVELTFSSNEETETIQQRLMEAKLTRPRSGFVAVLVNSIKDCIKVIDNDNMDTNVNNPLCDNRNVSSGFSLYSRTLCCHGGNLCGKNGGACLRNDDCQGHLVCGCKNCIQTAEIVTYFSLDDNCCTEPDSKDTSCSDDETPDEGDQTTTNRNPKNPNEYCLSNEDCSSNDSQMCLGDCTIKDDDNPYINMIQKTCCVNVTQPESCCNGTLFLKDVKCPIYDIAGTYVEFAPSITNASWTYVQLGNYNAMLMLETMKSEARYCRSRLIGHCRMYRDINMGYNDWQTPARNGFRPPGWAIMTSVADFDFNPGARISPLSSILHLAYTNDLSSSNCPAGGGGQTWFCYNDLMSSDWDSGGNANFLDVVAANGQGTIECHAET